MARKKPASDEGGGAYWMDTYGDLVTLLLCFFVLLFSFSSMDNKKWESLVGAFSGTRAVPIPVLDIETAMRAPIDLIMTTEEFEDMEEQLDEIIDELRKRELIAFNELYMRIDEYISGNGLDAELVADYERYIVTIRFVESVLFDSGRADLQPDSNELLDHMITLFNQNDNLYRMVRIEGHTDNRPISTSKFADNWELSTIRATTVVKYLVGSGDIDATKIMPCGFGEMHPIESNDPAQGQAANRRVDFVVEGYRS